MLHVNYSRYSLCFCDLGVFFSSPLVLWCDNLGATHFTSNLVRHTCTKHVDVNYHFVWDRVTSKSLVVSFLSNKDKLADIFTKPLSISRFTQLCTSPSVRAYQFGLQRDVEAHNT